MILVTGGTGFTGNVLIRKLCNLGCQVRVIARPTSNRSAIADLPIEWIEGDVFDENTVRQGMSGVNYVFHVAAAFREAKIDDNIYELVHVKSTKLLAHAAMDNPEFKRFVHVSTVGVLGHIKKPPSDETTPMNPGDVYQETKAVAEKWMLAFYKETGLPVTVVRPAAIYGPGDRRLLKLFKMAKMPVVPIIGFSKGLYHLIHVEDLVSFMVLVAVSPNTIGQIYICGNPEPSSIKEIIKTIAEYLGKKPIFIRLPAWPFFMLGDICEFVCKPLNIEPPIYRRRVAFFTKDRAFDTTKMRRETGFDYQYSNKDGLVETAKIYVENGWL